MAASFTSTVMPRETIHQAAIIAEDEVRYERVKKKGRLGIFEIQTFCLLHRIWSKTLNILLGYVRLITNFGSLNLELHCDLVPKTCENFIKLCQKGYYNGSKFHRSIRNFMVGIKNER